MTSATVVGFDTYSVGCFTHAGRAVGNEFATRAEAEEYFRTTARVGRMASIQLWGWTADGDCELLDEWQA